MIRSLHPHLSSRWRRARSDREREESEALKQEAAMAIRRGVGFLESRQDAPPERSGTRRRGDHRAGGAGDARRSGARRKGLPETAKKGYEFIATTKQPDGGLYVKGLANYNTSIC